MVEIGSGENEDWIVISLQQLQRDNNRTAKIMPTLAVTNQSLLLQFLAISIF